MARVKKMVIEFEFADSHHVYWLSDEKGYNNIQSVLILDCTVMNGKPAYLCGIEYGTSKCHDRVLLEEDLYETYDQCLEVSLAKYKKAIQKDRWREDLEKR